MLDLKITDEAILTLDFEKIKRKQDAMKQSCIKLIIYQCW